MCLKQEIPYSNTHNKNVGSVSISHLLYRTLHQTFLPALQTSLLYNQWLSLLPSSSTNQVSLYWLWLQPLMPQKHAWPPTSSNTCITNHLACSGLIYVDNVQ